MEVEVAPDNEAAFMFLARWSLQGPWVLTAIGTDKKSIETKTFDKTSRKKLNSWLEDNNGFRNIYFSVNPTIDEVSKKADRADIKEVAWLHVDIDPRAREDIDAERVRILQLLENPPGGVPKPNCIVFSGGGFQGFWKLETPIPINGDVHLAEEAKRYNLQLESTFGGDHCHNVDRIMRLPGTINLPDAKKIRIGRVPVLAKLVEFNDEIAYPLTLFKPAPALQAPGEQGFSTGQTVAIETGSALSYLPEDLDEWHVPDRIKVILVQGEHPDERTKKTDTSRSAWLFDALCGLARCGVPPEVMYSIITDTGYLISRSVLDKGLGTDKYARRQIERAVDFAKDPELMRLNDRYAVVKNMGGKCRVVEEVKDHTLQRFHLTRLTFEDFRNSWMNVLVQTGVDRNGSPINKPLGAWWLASPNRREFDFVIFAPGRDVPGAYNLWRGFAFEPHPGEKHESFLDHVLTNICGGNTMYYNYLIGWMALTVQKPDSQGHVAVVLRGGRGVGKGFFISHFGALFGRHFMAVSDPKHLVGSFNSHLRDCVVLFGDEAFYAGDHRHESILKTLITEQTLAIESKGIDMEIRPNFVHLMLASNADWIVPAGGDERRFFVLDVAADQQQNLNYFRKLETDLKQGGYEHLLHYLRNYDLSDFEVRRVPSTGALRDQKTHTLAEIEEWWYTKLVEGSLLEKTDGWPKRVMLLDLEEDYVTYMDRYKISRRGNKTRIGMFLKKMMPSMPPSQLKLTTFTIKNPEGFHVEVCRRTTFYEIPPLEICRLYWNKMYGDYSWETE